MTERDYTTPRDIALSVVAVAVAILALYAAQQVVGMSTNNREGDRIVREYPKR